MASETDFSIEVNISAGLQDTFRGARIVGLELVKATEFGVNLFLQEVSPLTPSGVTSNLRGANMSEIRGDGADAIRGRVFNAQGYALPVETGSRAHRAPFDKILLWARRTIGGRDYRKSARNIWYAISVRGTKPRRFYQTAWNRTEQRIEDRFDKALETAAAKIGGAS